MSPLVPDYADTFDGDLSGWAVVSGDVQIVDGHARLTKANASAVLATSTSMFDQASRFLSASARLRLAVLPAPGVTADCLTIQNQAGSRHFDLFTSTTGTWQFDLWGETGMDDVDTGIPVVQGQWYDVDVVVDYGDGGVTHAWVRIDGERFTLDSSTPDGLPSFARSLIVGGYTAKTYSLDCDRVSFTATQGSEVPPFMDGTPVVPPIVTPPTGTWLDEQDVLAWLGLDSSGPVLAASIATAEGLVPKWRLQSGPVDWATAKQTHPHVYNAAVRLAALIYQQTATPEGFAGFESAGGVILPDVSQMVSIRHTARANAPGLG